MGPEDDGYIGYMLSDVARLIRTVFRLGEAVSKGEASRNLRASREGLHHRQRVGHAERVDIGQ